MPRLAKENNIDDLLSAMINKTKEIYEKDNLQCPEGHVDINLIMKNNKNPDGTWGVNILQEFETCVPDEVNISGFYQCNDFAILLCYGTQHGNPWTEMEVPVFFAFYEDEKGDIRHIIPNKGNSLEIYGYQPFRKKPITYYLPDKYIISDEDRSGRNNAYKTVSPLYKRWAVYMFDSADLEIMLADIMSRIKTRNGQTIKVGKNIKDRWKRIYEYDPPEDYIPRRRILC